MSRSTIPSKRAADAQEAAWIADEDRFVLQQAKKKAAIRVRGGRAQPIDWLAVTLAVVDPERNPDLQEDMEDGADELEIQDPEGVFEGLDAQELVELEKGIETYITLETSKSNREYWNMMKTIAKDRRQQSQNTQQSARGVGAVASDLDKLLGPKSLEELEKLEKQINAKLDTNEPIDTDYWEHLLKSLLTYKARAKLRKVSQSIVEARLEGLRKQQAAEADALKARLEARVAAGRDDGHDVKTNGKHDERHALDPEPLLRLRQEDKALESLSEADFAQACTSDRHKVLKRRYIPGSTHHTTLSHPSKRQRIDSTPDTPTTITQPLSSFDREVARGLGDNEEIFTAEEPVTTRNLTLYTRPARKPRYFNRVQLGYEWNKYNQTHYDHDNPPPKVVQGYKFNIFYPDLVDKTKAPTYRLEREGGRRRGELVGGKGEGEEGTCLLRFVAGEPYEDLGFRVVDREWDYSAKRERGFRSSFDKGILQLHFQFKKIYYRK